MKYDAIVDVAWRGKNGEAVDGVPTYRTLGALPAATADRKVLIKAGYYEEAFAATDVVMEEFGGSSWTNAE